MIDSQHTLIALQNCYKARSKKQWNVRAHLDRTADVSNEVFSVLLLLAIQLSFMCKVSGLNRN